MKEGVKTKMKQGVEGVKTKMKQGVEGVKTKMKQGVEIMKQKIIGKTDTLKTDTDTPDATAPVSIPSDAVKTDTGTMGVDITIDPNGEVEIKADGKPNMNK